MKVAKNYARAVALVSVLAFSCDAGRRESQSNSSTAMAEHAETAIPIGTNLSSAEIEKLIDSFRSTPSSHVIRPGGPPTGGTEGSKALLRNFDRAAPALLAALAASDNDIRRHAAYTIGASKRPDLAVPLERAIATELMTHIRQPYTESGIPDDYYFAALRAMILAAARTGGAQSLKNVISSSPRDSLAVRALDDSFSRVVDRSPCGAENSRTTCLDKWHRLLENFEPSDQILNEDQ